MGYIQGVDRNQVILLPDTLDDYVSGDNEARAIDAFIDSLDISSMGFKASPAKEGRPGYDPRDMLKLYMYGYLNHIRSSRRLQKDASRNVELMWLLRKTKISLFRLFMTIAKIIQIKIFCCNFHQLSNISSIIYVDLNWRI